MGARFDHLVVAVDDLDGAADRWRAAGLGAEHGGAHPVGTLNVLVRGPQAAYVELIATGSEESNPWLDRVRPARGPISWAVAVDDVDAARAALVGAGFDPGQVRYGSRTTPAGEVVAWRMCDVGPGPYDGSLPFLIEWTSPMGPGPADGPVVEWLGFVPPDPERVADLLLALGFTPSEHWPRRVFQGVDGMQVTLSPVGEPVGRDGASWSMGWSDEDEAADEPLASLSLGVPTGEVASTVLDGVMVSTRPDRRRFPAASLLPAVDEAFARVRGDLADWPDPHPGGASPTEEEYSRREHPERYRLLVARADAWVETIVARGLGTAGPVDPTTVSWAAEQHLPPARTTVVRGGPGTQPVVVGVSSDETFVQVGVGRPAEVLARQPYCGCDACDDGSAVALRELDDAFVLALSGGVYAVREGAGSVIRSLDGWSGTGVEDGDGWLAEAADGRRTDGVVRGEPWL